MSYQKDRERFHLEAGRIGLSEYTTARLLRYASTLQRLAVAQCNGDYPADNGQRPVLPCARCEAQWDASAFRWSTESATPARICIDCRTAELVRAALHGEAWEARIEGDPRGYVLRLIPRGTSDEDYQSGRVRPIYVPGRER